MTIDRLDSVITEYAEVQQCLQDERVDLSPMTTADGHINLPAPMLGKLKLMLGLMLRKIQLDCLTLRLWKS